MVTIRIAEEVRKGEDSGVEQWVARRIGALEREKEHVASV